MQRSRSVGSIGRPASSLGTLALGAAATLVVMAGAQAADLPVKAKAVRKGDKIDISAEASGIEKPNEKLKLRLALVEDKVRFTGGNSLRFHHQVVRALPGGAKGFPIKDKSIKQDVTVDLANVKETITKYLETYNKDKPFSLFDLVGMQQFLEDELATGVDLTTRDSLHPSLRADIEQSAIRVF